MPWQDALRTVLEYTYDTLEKEGAGWAVVGSTATTIQGCRLSPHGLNISVEHPRWVYRFAELLASFAAAEHAEDSLPTTSAVSVNAFTECGYFWHSAGWQIAGFDVGVAHIADPKGREFYDGMVWECGPLLWPRVRRVAFAGYLVPVVPLEFQVGTNMTRERTKYGEDPFGRVLEIARVFRTAGYDRALLEWALRADHLARFDTILMASGDEESEACRRVQSYYHHGGKEERK
jgi:hypothetical protein